jgi:cytochrome d ubiquinol oxidase subunit II
MDLNTLWFILIGVLFTGFFFLEGFDYGVGILLPFLGKNDHSRRLIINTIGPHWDGNEVWLITAGGATFAAFPHWYATMFSGFYMALVLILLALILRGAGFEFRSKVHHPHWRSFWDWMIFLGSLLPALLLPVALFNLLLGTPIDASMTYRGSLIDLLNLRALLWGVAGVLGFIFHGALFLALKASHDVAEQARSVGDRVAPLLIIVVLVAAALGYFTTDVAARLGGIPFVVPMLAVAALVVATVRLRAGHVASAFVATGVAILLTVASLFMGLYPRVMVSSLNPEWSLTVYNAASGPYTLTIMSYITLVMLPIVLVYQGWSYWIFRKRLLRDAPLEY